MSVSDQVEATGHFAELTRAFLVNGRRLCQRPPEADHVPDLPPYPSADDDMYGPFPEIGAAATTDWWWRYPAVAQQNCFFEVQRAALHWDRRALVVGEGDGLNRRERRDVMREAFRNKRTLVLVDQTGGQNNFKEFMSGRNDALASSVTIAMSSRETRDVTAGVATFSNVVVADSAIAFGREIGEEDWRLLNEDSNQLPTREDVVVLPSEFAEMHTESLHDIFGRDGLCWSDCTARGVVDLVMLGAMPIALHLRTQLWEVAAAMVAVAAGLFVHALGEGRQSKASLHGMFLAALNSGSSGLPVLTISKDEHMLRRFLELMDKVPGGSVS
ncbi:hypothetical protein ABUW04_00030 [Streptacidiphilus sp. N1-10]|uniref:Uncharacterized protein n=1 Tax=Streptacidiphilus jeojiensis TaxID=3229225 RepID=A0ABV6XEE2_9ACTN